MVSRRAMSQPTEASGIRLIVKAGAVLCVAVLLAAHFWMTPDEATSVIFLIALLFLAAIALST
jgi:hypothetical protein